ncbi:MAG: cell division protein FtsL [Proteobacteria bacterium]|nr:MAG: cell division protein FtsL [Pseudomonadota bacterium]
MLKLNILLCAALVVCALAVVTSQHKARELFTQLAREQEIAKQIDVEWGQLQLEQSTWAMHARVEKVAAGYLQMRVPAPERVRLVTPELPRFSSQQRSKR